MICNWSELSENEMNSPVDRGNQGNRDLPVTRRNLIIKLEFKRELIKVKHLKKVSPWHLLVLEVHDRLCHPDPEHKRLHSDTVHNVYMDAADISAPYRRPSGPLRAWTSFITRISWLALQQWHHVNFPTTRSFIRKIRKYNETLELQLSLSSHLHMIWTLGSVSQSDDYQIISWQSIY